MVDTAYESPSCFKCENLQPTLSDGLFFHRAAFWPWCRHQHRLLGPLPANPWGDAYIMCSHIASVGEQACITSRMQKSQQNTHRSLCEKVRVSLGPSCQSLSDSGLQLCSKLSAALVKRLRMRNATTSTDHFNGNGDGGTYLNHTVVRMLPWCLRPPR